MFEKFEFETLNKKLSISNGNQITIFKYFSKISRDVI